MADYQDIPTALDFPNMSLMGFKHEGAQKPAMGRWSVYNDSVKFTTWTFGPNVPKAGYVGVRMSYFLFCDLMSLVRQASRPQWPNGHSKILENKTKPKEGYTPVVDSYIGVKKNEKTGAVHLIVQSADKDPARRAEFRLTQGMYGRIFSNDGEDMPIGEASCLHAQSWADGLQAMVTQLIARNAPAPKEGNGGNNGGYNRGNNRGGNNGGYNGNTGNPAAQNGSGNFGDVDF